DRRLIPQSLRGPPGRQDRGFLLAGLRCQRLKEQPLRAVHTLRRHEDRREVGELLAASFDPCRRRRGERATVPVLERLDRPVTDARTEVTQVEGGDRWRHRRNDLATARGAAVVVLLAVGDLPGRRD